MLISFVVTSADNHLGVALDIAAEAAELGIAVGYVVPVVAVPLLYSPYQI